MTETPARKPRPRRTFSAFGDVRRMPTEYEIVTHAQNWTLRQNRTATFEQNPSSALSRVRLNDAPMSVNGSDDVLVL